MSKKNIKLGVTYFFYGWDGKKMAMTPVVPVRIDGHHVHAEDPAGDVHSYTHGDLIEKENAGPFFERIADLNEL